MLLYLLIGVVAIVVGAMALLAFLRNVQPDDGEVAEDLKELKDRVKQFKNGLETWSEEISASEIDQILETGKSRTGSGVFLSTSNQPIFAYAFKKYIAPGKNAVIYILTSNHEFVFRLTNKGTEVTIDGQKHGLIRANGTLYDIKNNEVASVKRQGATAENRLFIGNKEVAKIALPDAVAGIRAIQFQGEPQPAEQQIIQTFAVYELVANISQIND